MKDHCTKVKITKDGKFYKEAIEDLQELIMFIEIRINDVEETIKHLDEYQIIDRKSIIEKLEDAKRQLETQAWHANNCRITMASMRRIVFPMEEVFEEFGFDKKGKRKKCRKKKKSSRSRK